MVKNNNNKNNSSNSLVFGRCPQTKRAVILVELQFYVLTPSTEQLNFFFVENFSPGWWFKYRSSEPLY